MLADRLNRKFILVTADVVRMLVIGLLPFVTQVWQVYALMFTVNAFTAFFTPTFQAALPAVTTAEELPPALSLSSATNELLGILRPGIAGAVAALLGARDIFFIDAATFLLSGTLIFTLPARLCQDDPQAEANPQVTVRTVAEGTHLLWRDAVLRYALLLAARVGGGRERGADSSQHRGAGARPAAPVRGLLRLDNGRLRPRATLAALLEGVLTRRLALTSLAVLPANHVGLWPLMGLWLLAGAGQNWVNLSTQTLLAEHTKAAYQGRVYGAHFAWSHLWWAFAYPLAGWLCIYAAGTSFLWGGLVALALLTGTWLLGRRAAGTPAKLSPAPLIN